MKQKKERLMDSTIYYRIFEFIQKEGYEPFLCLVNDLDDIQEENKATLITKSFIQQDDLLLKIKKKNKLVLEFLHQFKEGFLNTTAINSPEFINFIRNVSFSLKNPQGYFENLIAKRELYSSEKFDPSRYTLNHYLKNAKLLEMAKIGVVKIYPGLTTRNFSHSSFIRANIPYGQTIEINRNEDKKIINITKVYSDQPIGYNAQYGVEVGSRCEHHSFEIYNPSYVIVAKNQINDKMERTAYINDFGFNNTNMPDDDELSKYDLTKTLEEHRDEYIKSKRLPF